MSFNLSFKSFFISNAHNDLLSLWAAVLSEYSLRINLLQQKFRRESNFRLNFTAEDFVGFRFSVLFVFHYY